jgi:hypothetical protein
VPAKKVTVTRAAPGKKVGARKAAKAAKATEVAAAPEAPAKKAPTKKAGKFLPPLANGTRRKTATNLEPGDRVRRSTWKGTESKEVASTERDGRGLKVTYTDGTSSLDNTNTVYWMAPDGEAPRMRPLGIRRARPQAAAAPEAGAERDTPRSIDADLQAGRITRAEARERIRGLNREDFRTDRQRVRDTEAQPEARGLTRAERREDRRVAGEERAAIRAEGRQRREERGADLMTEARERNINTRDSAIREALEAQDGPNAYRAIRRLDGRISNDREQANLLDYGTRRAPDDQPADYTGGLSARSRRLRTRAAERARAVDLVWERGHRHEEEQRRPAAPRMRPMAEPRELTPRMRETRARAAERAEAAKGTPPPVPRRPRGDNETPRMTEVLDRNFERRQAAKKAGPQSAPARRPRGDNETPRMTEVLDRNFERRQAAKAAKKGAAGQEGDQQRRGGLPRRQPWHRGHRPAHS